MSHQAIAEKRRLRRLSRRFGQLHEEVTRGEVSIEFAAKGLLLSCYHLLPLLPYQVLRSSKDGRCGCSFWATLVRSRKLPGLATNWLPPTAMQHWRTCASGLLLGTLEPSFKGRKCIKCPLDARWNVAFHEWCAEARRRGRCVVKRWAVKTLEVYGQGDRVLFPS